MTDSARIESLLSRMTLAEKVGQMRQISGAGEGSEEAIRAGAVGSFLNVIGDQARAFQRLAVEESRLGIPLIFGRDVIHGFRTAFPIPLGLAATFDPEVVREAARIAAREASAAGVHWTFAPMVDIARDPRWGRIAEGCGEDPYLASCLAAALVEGFQGRDLSDPERIAACAKHYVGYGSAEGGRDYNTTWIPEGLLRDVYLPPFEACVRAGAATFMSAFNDLNGVPATGNAFTLRQVLKGEWGFDGFVVSDWESVTEMISHGYAADARDAAAKAVAAGVDMEMVSTSYEHLESLEAAGLVDVSQIDDSVRRILRIKERLGLFDDPYRGTPRPDPSLSPDHLEAARRAASGSCVLLKNDGLLPLSSALRTVAVVGPLADAPTDQIGCWAFDARGEDSITPLQALRQALGADRVLYAPGLDSPRSTDLRGFADAVAVAQAADAVLLFVGEDALLSGEGHSRAFLDLPGAQAALTQALVATGTPVAAVVMAGRPLVLGELAEQVQALLLAWHPGTMGGSAIVDLLLGRDAPSGRLPVSMPRTVGQVPVYYNHKNTGRPPRAEGPTIPTGTPLDPEGFTASYLDVDHRPLYPFGYGLTYTDFAYSDLKVSTASMPLGGAIEVSARVSNVGRRAGVEVVQLYVRDLVASLTRPVRELKGFQRVALGPGESERVRFVLRSEDLAFHNAHMQRVTEPGRFMVWIGPDARRGLEGEFEVVG
ncbi:MAG: glycoside hydrolase family 3 N-terminal domain-containing protein [Anaerolineae bacterium]